MANRLNISSFVDLGISAHRPAKPRAKVVTNWAAEPETQKKLQAYADAAIEALHQDMMLRVPRDENLRKNGFAEWLKSRKALLAPAVETEFRRQFPNPPGLDLFDSLSNPAIWDRVELELLQYAIRGLSTGWAVRNLGDAIVLENPQRTGENWVVSLKYRRDGSSIGSIVLDGDGNVITESGSIRPGSGLSRQSQEECLQSA